MGDYFQKFGAVDVGRDEAPEVGERLRKWLLDEQIMLEQMSDCVLSEHLGYPPGLGGKQYIAEDEAPYWERDILTLRTNGIEINVGPHVLHLMQSFGDGSDHICPLCGGRHPDETMADSFYGCIDPWFESDAQGDVACPSCGHSSNIRTWRTDPPTIGVTNLSMIIWNWPETTPEFAARLSEVCGSEIVRFWDKL